MLDAFRNLPPVGRIIVLALGFSVLLGVILLISLLVTGGPKTQTTNTDPGTSGTNKVTEAPSTAIPSTAIPKPQPSVSIDFSTPKPTRIPNDQQPQKSGLSKTVISKAFANVLKGVMAYCTYTKGEDNTARAARLAPYFAPNSDLASSNNNFITSQKCLLVSGDVLTSDGKNKLTLVYYLSAATQYLQSDLSDNKATAELKDVGYKVQAEYVNGKWIIDTINIR